MPGKLTLIVAGMPGCGKSTIARALAKKYGLEYYAGGDALKEMAVKRGYKPGGVEWWETPEGKRFFSEREKNFDFDREVDRILMKKAEQGGFAFTTRTLPWLGAPGIKIWLAVSSEERARRIAGRDKISFQEALKKIKEREFKERALYQALYGFRLGEDLAPFDLIIDTDKLTAEQTVKEIVEFVDRRLKKG